MKKAVIIGASSGIGHEVARFLICDGWHVGLVARRERPLEVLKDMAPDKVICQVCDITQADSPNRIKELIDKLGGLDLYFHAAGIGSQNIDLEPQKELDTINTNVVGFCRLVDMVFGYMTAHEGGQIAIISSIAGTKGLAPAPSYSASKAFQSTYIQALEQLAYSRHLPISFTDIRPGFVDTPLIADSNFPMKMSADKVARKIVNGVYHHRHVLVIDWRYRLLTLIWHMVPNWIWRRIPLARHY